jgi:hypothetical protein
MGQISILMFFGTPFVPTLTSTSTMGRKLVSKKGEEIGPSKLCALTLDVTGRMKWPLLKCFFLTDDDAALTGRAFAVNPDPIGLMSDGTKDPNIPEAVATIVDKPRHVEPSANAAVASKTSFKTIKVEGSRSSWPRRTATRPPSPPNGCSSATSVYLKVICLRGTVTPNTPMLS